MARARVSTIGLVVRAAAFAAEKHRDQRRKSGDVPYINHPLELARLLVEVGQQTDGDVLAAALLHDTVEDTDTTFAELEANFGAHVAGIVRELTDDKALPKADRKRRQVEHAPHASPEAALVKLADKLANLTDIAVRPPTSWSAEQIQAYFVWSRAVVEAIGHANEGLGAELDAIFACHTPADADERARLLDAYYTAMANARE